MTFEPGQTIDQRFLVKQRLGGNTHGSTCKAVSLLTEKPVVLKKLNHDPGQGMQKQLQLAQQAQQLSQSCDQLMTIQEVSVEEDHVYYVLPFLPARSLKRLQPPTAADQNEDIVYFAEDFHWLTRIAQALDFLANQNTVHGDVKPTNILFDKDIDGNLTAFLSDIEIPKPKGDKKKGTDEYSGTMAYLAREVFLDPDEASARSDQYSLAVTIYQWLSGELPFKGATGIDMYNAFKAGATPITDHCPQLPQPVADAIHRGLSKEPEDRFDTLAEFAAAILEDLPKRTKPGRLSWQLISSVAAIAATVVFAIVIGGKFLNPANQQVVDDLGKQVPPVNDLNSGANAEGPGQQAPSGPTPPALQNPNVTPNNNLAVDPLAQTINPPTVSKKKPDWRQGWSPEGGPRMPTIDRPAGPALEPSKQDAFQKLLRAAQANQRDPELRYRLAVAYETGNGVKANIDEAIKHFHAAATLNSAKAQFKLAQYYEQAGDEHGRGANADLAYQWYMKAAKQGLPEAQWRIGQYYEQLRTPEKLEQAYKWYEKAANQDRPDYSRYLAQFCVKHGDKKNGAYWTQKADQQEREQDPFRRKMNQELQIEPARGPALAPRDYRKPADGNTPRQLPLRKNDDRNR